MMLENENHSSKGWSKIVLFAGAHSNHKDACSEKCEVYLTKDNIARGFSVMWVGGWKRLDSFKLRVVL